MKKILYLDLKYHLKTNSTRFLYDILKKNFLIDEQFIESNGEVCKISENYSNCYYDYLVLFQVMPNRKSIDAFSYGSGILFPMYDGCLNKTITDWKEYKDFTIINFSKTLHDYLLKNGFNSKYIQYYPKIQEIRNYGSTNSIFFWQRTSQIHINQILSMCNNLNIKKVHIHKVLDPNYYYIPPNKKYDYEFSYSNWFPEKSSLLEIIFDFAYYVAPRKYEGIGMSFLDAMAIGRCVIAPNYPTMNEYIENGINGILYDYENPKDIEIYDVKKLQKNAYQSINRGYKLWLKNKYKIIDWIEQSNNVKMQGYKSINKCINIQVNKQENKYYSYYLLMNRWMLLKNRRISLVSWFEDKAAYHIAVYGYSDMASRLTEELEGSSIHIDYYLDKEKKWTEDGKQTIQIEEFVSSVDIIVITAFYYYDEIKKMLDERFLIGIISLKEIIDDLIKKI